MSFDSIVCVCVCVDPAFVDPARRQCDIQTLGHGSWRSWWETSKVLGLTSTSLAVAYSFIRIEMRGRLLVSASKGIRLDIE